MQAAFTINHASKLLFVHSYQKCSDGKVHHGLDDIGLTMEKKSSIDAYEARLKERAWA